MARGPADRLGIVRAVNADMRLAQPHPENADWVIRTGRQIVEDARFLAMIEHTLIVAEDGQASRCPRIFHRPIGAGQRWMSPA